MKLYSTKNKTHQVDLREAVLKGLPPDNGLYMPEHIPALPPDFIQNLKQYSFPEIAFTVAHTLIGDSIPAADLKQLVEAALYFPAPVEKLDDETYVLELFHGPSLAFKDFGARFMAQLMSYYNRGEDKELVILVATSGDTGGAVAAGFYQALGIEVVILYPSGKVSPLQEKQLTTLGHNITALEVNGTFDDCQAIVKQAFLDSELNEAVRLSSANSINISRLIPQSFYYYEAYKQLPDDGRPVVFCIPSGNFGNLTAGLLAKEMGLPIHHFIAATNDNDVVPEYLESGVYTPRPSVRTISNAMDVGNPSNFARMIDLYGGLNEEKSSTWNNMRHAISGFGFSDAETEAALNSVLQQHNYLMDPHGAVGYLALKKYQSNHPGTKGVILETAHPAKFLEDMERVIGRAVPIPEALAAIAHKPKDAVWMENNYQDVKSFLLQKFR